MDRWTSVIEASKLLGKSERTIRRWMAGGRLSVREVPTGQEVNIGPYLLNPNMTDDAMPETTDRRATLASLRQEVAMLRELNRQVTDERDYLRQALGMALSLQQKQIAETVETGRRHWWQFGRGSTA